jgi:hypothetical protein
LLLLPLLFHESDKHRVQALSLTFVLEKPIQDC